MGAGGLGDRVQARLASRARPAGALSWPEPRVAGDPVLGRRLLRGRLRIGDTRVEEPGRVIWDLAPEEPERAVLHDFRWLDDLAAVGEVPTRTLAQGWTAEWIARFGQGAGPGWTPELAAERLIRLLGHARVLLHPPGVGAERLAQVVAAHTRFLEKRWPSAPAGRPRIAALSGLLAGELALPERRAQALRTTRALSEEAGRFIDREGAIATRNPEELLDGLAFLVEANARLTAADLPTDPGIVAAMARGVPTLRALRHADGSLARFHGGCRGTEGRLDQVLAAAGRPSLNAGAQAGLPLHMGFLKLAAGRTTVIVDAAAPPMGPASHQAHASTLAFELTSGRRPLVVSLGPARGFGSRWRRAVRATASHSTLSLDTLSSSRLGLLRPGQASAPLADGPRRVLVEAAAGSDGLKVDLAHDGWRGTNGLTHARILRLTPDGRALEGEDMLTTLTEADRAAFDAALNASNRLGLAFALRFHLHPDVEAALGDRTVELLLPSGEEWTFSHESEATLALEPSVYLEEERLKPRPTQQIVLAGRALRSVTRLRWTLAKGYGTPEALRDLNPRTDWDEEDE